MLENYCNQLLKGPTPFLHPHWTAITAIKRFLKLLISVSTLWRNFGPLLLAELIQLSDICRPSSINCAFQVLPQHFNRAYVWTLTTPFQKCKFLVFFLTIVGWLACVLWIIVLLHNPSALQLQTDDQTFFWRILWCRAEFRVPNTSKSWCSKASLNHHTNIRVLHITEPMLTKKLHFRLICP